MSEDKKLLVIVSRVKEINKAAGYSTSEAYLQTLSDEVERLIKKGQGCAQQNGRKTLKPQDV